MHNKDNNITIIWNILVNTDRTITAKRPDIIVKDLVNFTSKLLDMTVASFSRKWRRKARTKTYRIEIQRMWQL